jgi:uncharacterized protein YbbC (DUF1343 family)/uncharacterized lipoprotein YddW (UPF0748 family)
MKNYSLFLLKSLVSMFRKSCLIFVSFALIYTLSECKTHRPISQGDPSGMTPNAEREFRAAWVATVANINWPSKRGLTVEEQKKEAIKLLDLLHENNFNAVIFQARPQGDALYKSDLEPWSYYLTGEQGKAPDPYYDPLEFWTEEAHKRALEIHVWLNPYRAHHPTGGSVSEHSIVKKHPELVVNLETGYWWMDPSLQGTRDHSYNVVMDIVKRYDIDGIHFDDYFYPYPSYNNNKDFPDHKNWSEYLGSGGKLSRGDWRRKSVNVFIERLYKGIKKEKPHVKFGLSPFGIWRPNNPLSIQGFDQHNQLYADAKLWLNKGWIDYYTPQLYWPINQVPQSFPVLLGWWKEQNLKGRHLWPGMSVGRRRGAQRVDETMNQIMISRGMTPESPGVVHWSIEPLLTSPDLLKALREGPYKKPALVPSSPWLSKSTPKAPVLNISTQEGLAKVSWKHENHENIQNWVVYSNYGSGWNQQILGSNSTEISIPGYKINFSYEFNSDESIDLKNLISPLKQIGVSAVDRFGNESEVKTLSTSFFNYENSPVIEEILSEINRKKQKTETPIEPLVKPGIDVLVEDHLDLIKGKKIGLITNPSAVGSDLRSTLDILANTEGVELTALFGAEHGVRGAKQGRIYQQGEVDPATGAPVYSMYGDSYAPKQEWLKDLDVLIFDIQGVGSSWYTFKFSMSWAMEASAKAGVPFIVLDRPNPLGGRIVEGPYLHFERIYRHKLPLRHGMTYGELATMWNKEEGYGANLTVIKMKGWRRGMFWNQTGLHWVMPSPNMGTVETAIVYPGQCLFEAMNVSEGRGTTKPFLLTGASWVNAEKAAEDLNSRGIKGAKFRPVYFIPRIDPNRKNTRNKPWNRMSGGVEILLTDYSEYKSVEAALHIIDAYKKTNPDSLVWSPPPILKKLENPDVSVSELVQECQNEIQEFIDKRTKYLFYR